MADDDILLTAKLELDAGSVAQDAASAGKQAGDAFSGGFKPTLSIRPDAVEKSAKESAKVFSDAFSGVASSITAALEKALSNVDVSKTGFGKGIEDVIRQSIASHKPQPGAGGREPREEPTFDLSKRIQPFLSGVETLSLLLRSAPLTSVLQMAGQTYRDFSELQRERRERETPRRGGGGGGGGGEEPPRPPGGGGGAAGAAGEGAAGAAGFGLVRALGIGAGVIAGIAGAGVAAYELAEATKKLGEEGAETTLRWHGMRQIMGLSQEQFAKLSVDFAKGGLNIEDSHRALARLAVTAKREMPEIERKVEDYSNVTVESRIKVEEAERGVTKARIEQQAATEHVKTAEGELVKEQTTGVELRAQQIRAAQLAVSGAQLGARRAAVQAQFAPAEAAIADVRGPLTVAGARLGLRGAQLSADEARAKLAEVASGQREDPEAARARQIMRAQHQVEIAEHNQRQASLRIREAKEEEEKRKALPGPEEVAAQAQQEAEMHERQTQITLRRMEIDQRYNDFQEEKAKREVDLAKLTEKAAPAQVEMADINLDRLRKAQERQKYEQIVPVREQLQRLARGEPLEEGYQFRKITPEALRGAITLEGGGEVGPIWEFMRKLVPGMEKAGASRAEQLTTVQSVFRGRGGIGDAERMLGLLRKPEGEYTHEDMERRKQIDELIAPEKIDQAKIIREQEGAARLDAQIRQTRLGQQVTPEMHAGATAVVESVNTGLSSLASNALQAATALGQLVGALPSSKKESLSVGVASEVTNQAEGGLLSGPGSETSDSIPINASRGEFIVKASAVNEVGVPFLNALNEGRAGFQAGGSVDETYEQYVARVQKTFQEKLKQASPRMRSSVSQVGPMAGVNRDDPVAVQTAFQEVLKQASPRMQKSVSQVEFSKDQSSYVGYLATPRGATDLQRATYIGEHAAYHTLYDTSAKALDFGKKATLESVQAQISGASRDELRKTLDKLRGIKPGERDPISRTRDEGMRSQGYRIPPSAAELEAYRKRPGYRPGDRPDAVVKTQQQLIEDRLRMLHAMEQEKATAVIRENPFFGKTPEEQTAMLATGTGLRFPPSRPGEEPVATRPTAAAVPLPMPRLGEVQGPPDLRPWQDRPLRELLAGAFRSEVPDTTTLGERAQEQRGGLSVTEVLRKQFEETRQREPPRETRAEQQAFRENIGRYSPTPLLEMTPKETFEKLETFFRPPPPAPEKEPTPEPLSPASIHDVFRTSPLTPSELIKPDEAGNYAGGGLVGMQAGGSVEDARNATRREIAAASVHVTPVRVDPVRVDPVRADPVRVSPVRVDPVRADPVRVSPVRVDPVRIMPGVGFRSGGSLAAVQQLVRGYASGGFVGGFADHVMGMSGYAEGGVVNGKTNGGGNTLSYHQLDIRTNAGNFRAGVSEDTMDGLRNSSLGRKLTQTAPMPSWYS